MDRTSNTTDTVASVVFHVFMIMGELGVVSTAFLGINRFTTAAAFLLYLAGLITLVYPAVGTHSWYAVFFWGKPRRSGLPWLLMLALLAVSLGHAGL